MQEQGKENKEEFNFETLATNGLTAYNIYIFMTYLFILFNDTVNTPSSSQLWLSSGAVSLDFRIAWELLIDTIIQVGEFVDVVCVVGCSHPFWRYYLPPFPDRQFCRNHT